MIAEDPPPAAAPPAPDPHRPHGPHDPHDPHGATRLEARGRPLRDFLDELEQHLADHRSGPLLNRIRTAITRAREALREQLNGHGDELRVHLPLDGQLNEPEYLELRFHQDVHLYSLLTATRLLLNSRPHQLWDMVRAALSYTSGAQRGALLQRLANFETAVPMVAVLDERDAPLGPEETRAPPRGDEGPHATHHAQFASLASPPLLTLSLEPDSPYNLGRGAAAVTLDDDDLRYRVRLSSSESNATLPQGLRRVNPRAIEDALSGLDSLLRSAAASDAEWHYLQSMGGSLGEDIIGDLKRPLELMRAELERESPGRLIHLALQIPRELMRYPWELMSDGEQLLSQRFAIGRQVWTDSTRVIPPEQRDTDPLRVLIVGDPRLHPPYPASAQLTGARAEAEEVAALFEELSREFGPAMDFRRDRDVFIHTTLTRAAMRRLLRDRGYDIVHFAGHGVFYPNHPERSAWLLSDGPLWASELRNTFAWSNSPPWLIYANACDAGMSSDRPSSLYTGDVFGLATACINQGVEAYIAPLWPIADEPGRLFATSFYRELMLRRSTLGVALHTARAATERACRAKATTGFGLFDISWASMVLYGEPGARLIDALGGEL